MTKRKEVPFLTPMTVIVLGTLLFLWGMLIQHPQTLAGAAPLYIIQIRAGLLLTALGLAFQGLILVARICAAKKKESKDS